MMMQGQSQLLKPDHYKSDLKKIFQFFFPFLMIALVWEIGIRSGVIRATNLPAPSEILAEFWALMWVKGVLWQHFFASLYRLVIGYTLAVVAGVAIGTLLSLNSTLRALFEPVLSLLISIPTIAWMPVLLITMGLAEKTVITVVFLGGFFAITYNTMRGIEMVNKNLINAARIMGLSGYRLFLSVLFPGSMVSLITGLRLGISYSWRALVGGEMLAAMIQWGVGKMIFDARFWNDVKVMFVGILLIGFSGYLLDFIFLRWLEKTTIEKWGMVQPRTEVLE